jgi:hypothetical protein
MGDGRWEMGDNYAAKVENPPQISNAEELTDVVI